MNMVFKVLTQAIRLAKEIESMHIKQEIKSSIFVDSIVL